MSEDAGATRLLHRAPRGRAPVSTGASGEARPITQFKSGNIFDFDGSADVVRITSER